MHTFIYSNVYDDSAYICRTNTSYLTTRVVCVYVFVRRNTGTKLGFEKFVGSKRTLNYIIFVQKFIPSKLKEVFLQRYISNLTYLEINLPFSTLWIMVSSVAGI